MIAPHRRRVVPRLLILWVLLLLPLMQLGGLAHGYGHLATSLQAPQAVQAPALPDQPVCETCVAFSTLNGGCALPATSMPLPADTAALQPRIQSTAFHLAALRPYASRAPPHLIA